MKVDLHLHTFRSPDSLTSYDAVIDAVQQRSLDAIAVTDHNTIQGALELRECAPFPVIVAEEIRTTAGEIFGYFIEQEISRGLPLEETIARVKAQGGIVGAPHPVDRTRSGIGEAAVRRFAEQIDVLEGFNARCVLSSYNERARQLARELNKPITAGSDAHSAREIGNGYVEMARFDDAASFLENMASATWHGQRTNVVVRLASTWAKFVKRFR